MRKQKWTTAQGGERKWLKMGLGSAEERWGTQGKQTAQRAKKNGSKIGK